MKSARLFLTLSAAVVLAAPAVTQQHTLARLSRENRSEVAHVDLPGNTRAVSSGVALHDSATSHAAGNALFAKSDLQRARLLSDRALRRDPQDAEALFVRMELAGMQADKAAALDAAVRLCEAGVSATGDPRVRLAAVRVREAASNTPNFRAIVPRLQTLLANSRQPWPDLHLALLNAAMDGAPGLDPYALSRSAGILTDWRIVGPMGSRTLLDPDQPSISSADDLASNSYAGRRVENFQFPDGWIHLPDYLGRNGTFYATAKFASFTSETRKVTVEGHGSLQVFVDGQQVLRTAYTGGRDTLTFEATPGPHRVLVRFTPSATPLRVAVVHDSGSDRTPLRAGISTGEAAYLIASEDYSNGEFSASMRQIEAVDAPHSAALQFLHAQALAMSKPQSGDGTKSAQGLHGEPPASDVAGEERLWAQRVADHPSCAILQGALAFYDSRGMKAERDEAQEQLEGCAPESLAYAHSLAGNGRHKEAAEALRKLIAAAPLNREARLMLVRELQLAGDDAAAQQAAAEWLRIAPNAQNYHRLAVAATDPADTQVIAPADFFLPYRRNAAPLAREAGEESRGVPVVLLDDHVAIARPDGSVSLYVHVARQLPPHDADVEAALSSIPPGAQVLALRILHRDGTFTPVNVAQPGNSNAAASAGDVVDAEYVMHFTGDGGIPEHAEAFQFTFGNFDQQVLKARFVVLTPADRAYGGVAIETGSAPAMTTTAHNGMLERVWEKDAPDEGSGAAESGLAIVRVVEQENGWSVPSKAEHQKRIETIHPGPRPEDS